VNKVDDVDRQLQPQLYVVLLCMVSMQWHCIGLLPVASG
jgi:hypothetical protein